MTALLFTLIGLALVDSLNVLNVGIVSAVVYDNRLHRRSALPAGVSYIAGVFGVTITVGLCAVLGLGALADLPNFNPSAAVRFWGELSLGLVLIVLACFRLDAHSNAPGWAALSTMRQRPWMLGFVGSAVGLGQAFTSVPYLAGLTMIAALQPRPAAWPAIVIAYCFVALLPSMTLLGLSTSRSRSADRAQRWLVKALTRYGQTGVRILFLFAGVALVADAVLYRQ